LIAIGIGITVPVVLDLISDRIATEVEERLGLALGGNCRIGKAQWLSQYDVALQELACVMDSGPLLGIASRSFSANFEDKLTSGKLSPLNTLAIDGLEVRLRELPDLAAVDDDRTFSRPQDKDEPGDIEQDQLPPTERAELMMLRFIDLSRVVSQGRGGGRVAALRDRLSTSGTVSVNDATVNGPDGAVLLSNLHGQVSRTNQQMGLALALQLNRGGILSLDATLTESGLAGARVRLEQLPVADWMNEVFGERLSVREAKLSASLRHIDSAEEQTWQLEAGLSDFNAGNGFLGKGFVTLPAMRLEGKLVNGSNGTDLSLTDGRWEVAGIGGELGGRVGPLGDDEQPRFEVSGAANQLPLGKLLGSLPELVMPGSWAEEVQGTMDIHLVVSGRLHERNRWSLDWNGDFSRMVLVSGELASMVERLNYPFEHTFRAPGAEGKPLTRLVGGEDPHFAPLSKISSHLANAVVSTEDGGFFRHSGFSPRGLTEAMLENLREGSGRGGSTITQQLAKNLFLSGDRTIARKLQEAIIAWRLESNLPKKRILEIYLNIAEWGPGLYGIRDAANHYFGRSPRVLRPEEAAFLASLLPSPRRYHSYYHGRGVSRQRHKMVQKILRSMHRTGRLRGRDFELALDERIEMIGCTW